MKWMDRFSLVFFIRLQGAIMVVGSIFLLLDSGWNWGWFSAPSVVIGILVGPGLFFHQRWARFPAMTLFGYWLILGVIILVFGSSIYKGIPIIIAGAVSLLILWKWSGPGVLCEKV